MKSLFPPLRPFLLYLPSVFPQCNVPFSFFLESIFVADFQRWALFGRVAPLFHFLSGVRSGNVYVPFTESPLPSVSFSPPLGVPDYLFSSLRSLSPNKHPQLRCDFLAACFSGYNPLVFRIGSPRDELPPLFNSFCALHTPWFFHPVPLRPPISKTLFSIEICFCLIFLLLLPLGVRVNVPQHFWKYGGPPFPF